MGGREFPQPCFYAKFCAFCQTLWGLIWRFRKRPPPYHPLPSWEARNRRQVVVVDAWGGWEMEGRDTQLLVPILPRTLLQGACLLPAACLPNCLPLLPASMPSAYPLVPNNPFPY